MVFTDYSDNIKNFQLSEIILFKKMIINSFSHNLKTVNFYYFKHLASKLYLKHWRSIVFKISR